MNPIQITIGTDNFNRPEALLNVRRSERSNAEHILLNGPRSEALRTGVNRVYIPNTACIDGVW